MLRSSACFAWVILTIMAPGVAGAQETIDYQYDALGRMIVSTHKGASPSDVTTIVAYDPAGNRSNYSVTNGGPPPSPTSVLSIGNATATEGQPLVFTVSRSGDTSIALNVDYASQNGSATAGADYNPVVGTINFASGQAAATISVQTIDDLSTESTETFDIILSNATSGATISNSVGLGSIVDNDGGINGWASSLTSGTWNYCDDYSCYTYDGYMPSQSIGSMSNTSWNGYTVSLLTDNDGVVSLGMFGSQAPPNSGWTSIIIPGIGTLNRVSASYVSSGVGATWYWHVPGTISSGTVTIQ